MRLSYKTFVIVNDQAHISGGAPLVAIVEARELASRGHRVIFFSAVAPIAGELTHPLIEVVCLGQKEIISDPNRLRAAFGGIWNVKARRALRACLTKENPKSTLVHFHVWMKCLSPAVLGVPHALGFRAVLTQHDFFVACPTGGFYDFGARAICMRRPLSGSCICARCDSRSYPQKLWRVVRSLVQAKMVKIESCIDMFISVSSFANNILAQYQPNLRRVVVDNPAPMERHPRRNRNETRDLLFVGRLSEEKGLRLLKRATRATGIKVRLVGSGPLQTELATDWPEATFLGWLPRTQVQAEMRAARALVFPSLWYETAGLVAIEAAATGLPVIVADTCAATSYVQHEKTGVWFTGGSVEALTAALVRCQDDVAVEEWSVAAYNWYWSSPWTVARHVDALIEVYASIPPPTPA